MKTAVYSWRVSLDTKTALEDEARQRGASLAELLDDIANDWLQARRVASATDRKREDRLRARAMRTFGLIAGGDPERASRARETLRQRLRARRAGRR